VAKIYLTGKLSDSMLKRGAQLILKTFGWKAVQEAPVPRSAVMIGAPHTSNWDFILAMLVLGATGTKAAWVAKHTLFRWPMGMFFRMIGGIPVDRSSGTAFLKRVIELFKQDPNLVLAIAPEGTRSKTRSWKKGFYIIALKANVPIVPAYVDYPKKTVGLGPIIYPTGDLEADFRNIQSVYKDKIGKYPQNQGEVRVKTIKSKIEG